MLTPLRVSMLKMWVRLSPLCGPSGCAESAAYGMWQSSHAMPACPLKLAA